MSKKPTERQVRILRARGLKPSDIGLIREMWAAGEWGGHKVTVPMLAEIFFTTRHFIGTVVKNEAFKGLGS